jgi:hypothetical protein
MIRGLLPCLLLAWLVAFPVGEAWAQGVKHRVKKGESAASLSAHYYGSRRHGRLILAANGMGPKDRLWNGSEVLIPTARPHIVTRRTTFEALAKKLLGARSRWTAFKTLNRRVARRRRVAKGDQVWVPYVFSHRVKPKEGWADISRAYLGTRRGKDRLARYNFRSDKPPRSGADVLIPVSSLHLTRQRLVQLLNSRVLGVSSSKASATGSRPALARARAMLGSGEFAAVTLELLRQLSPLLSRARDRAEVFRLAGTALVALERPALANRAFAEMLRHQPDLKLDRKDTSPVVLQAVEAAAKADKK